ncbi:NAD(P)H-hydrate epimerase [Ectothiorhodospira mobilis]|uniref:Bifunctional NAD(P)H-hydrate repair enzyme n=1 Tax=Ectothiorhodospira mobilis TaxID=195064 RepID=A0A1I4QTD5_ECTMO|nr:NAD(P)H-hydrate dehydratase [Ectothiorhodospira mobilis]SFM42993.1 NAD(P)H-hydrate epimerase [Ectothiorhodospira mobilis]
MTLPEALYTADQVRELDRRAIQGHGIPGYTLMQRAGAAALEVLDRMWPRGRVLAVVCGPGNNGGDGYVLARLARAAGWEVRLAAVTDPGALQGDAARAWGDWRAAGGGVVSLDAALEGCDVIVDALLGTGLGRPVEGAMAEAILRINAAGVPVLSLDIPSGLGADTGAVLGRAVRARATVTFIGLKLGLFTGEGREHGGEVHFDALAVPAAVYAGMIPSATRADAAVLGRLPRRRRSAHKGDFGHVLVVGGAPGMPGAVRMAAEAAARVGAGLVSVATHAGHAALIPLARPEVMAHGVTAPDDLDPLLERATVVAVGPGLGQGDWGRALLQRVLAWEGPRVLDADALNLLAGAPQRRGDWVLTPHPGEAARLLGCTTARVQADRPAAAAALQARYGGVCVLKGSGTLVHDGRGLTVCTGGNPGMASGGMGDVLTGILAGGMAQGLAATPGETAVLGVCAHARAADMAAGEGERGLLASDLLNHLRGAVNP